MIYYNASAIIIENFQLVHDINSTNDFASCALVAKRKMEKKELYLKLSLSLSLTKRSVSPLMT